MIRLISYFVILFLFTACDLKKQELKELVKTWRNKEIIFPDDLKMKINGRDTVDEKLFAHKYKILNYVDTTGCNECMLKFYDWKLLKNQIDSLKLDVSILYVVFANKYRPVEVSQQLNKFNIPVFYDSLGIMGKQNKFPADPSFKTFLLDSSNRVIGIGNPVINKEIWKLYKDKIYSLDD